MVKGEENYKDNHFKDYVWRIIENELQYDDGVDVYFKEPTKSLYGKPPSVRVGINKKGTV